ncbi:hypothetical protein D6C86_07485 [Aureobasidium pullulans]|uniref:DUF3533 domain-containing protein n=2 Tax=Aureobasidium pullulans TaxID=5580 RepID=A0A074XIK4_AURPU|nr:uncharacterized protein M438DRAFT_316812 [Aureobasidium pullulans EXF-150]KAG2164500.1 hypothetical protein JADG_004239 [Aureobasidium pullulans]KEQ85345.1 hypothetical protein M438DRAFT_316812 [Aureobasidium pullulans EXF-150]THV75254.1 hypothetical protein D6D28_01951 [Aureobasidium pullulans]THV88645.1 hypothetical protein D6D26_09877 [Aureobasidium pullulans]THW12493.1 hypothetical protein D6D24_06568 [Aureobasidium pullulans]
MSSKENSRERPSDNSQQDGDSEEKGEEEKPKPVGIFSPELKDVKKEIVKKWCLTTVTLMAAIMAVLSLYWASLFHVEANLSALVVYVVDFDGQTAPYNTSGIEPIVGPIVQGLARTQVASGTPTLGWGPLPGSAFNYDPLAVRQAVYDWDAWAAIIIMPNATQQLYNAVQNGNTSYDPMGACQLIYQSARDDTSWYDFMLPLISQFQTEATSMVGQQWARMVLQNATTDQTLARNIANVPQAVSPAIGFSEYDLRPFYPYTAIPATTIGLIYLIILSFFSFAFYLPIWFKFLMPKGHPPLRFVEFIAIRWGGTVLAYLFLSLAYSLVSLAFQINFSGGNPITSTTQVTEIEYGNPDAYGHGTFPVYWMLNFVGMCALGLASENVAMVVGQPWTGLWLIFWVITNVTTSFYDIDIEPAFFRWGYAWPLHNVVEGSRQILFGLHSRIGLNFGILFAWAAVNSAVFPLACWFLMYKRKHEIHEYWA